MESELKGESRRDATAKQGTTRDEELCCRSLFPDAATSKARIDLRRQAELHSATLVVDVSSDLETWVPIETVFGLISSGTSEDGLYLNLEYEQKDPGPLDTVFLLLKASSSL